MDKIGLIGFGEVGGILAKGLAFAVAAMAPGAGAGESSQDRRPE